MERGAGRRAARAAKLALAANRLCIIVIVCRVAQLVLRRGW
jgi:hypothetical protein